MNISRRDNSPLSSYRPSLDDQFGRLVENMFEDFLIPYASAGRLDATTFSPRLNVLETDRTFEIELEMPGVEKKNVKVAIDNRNVSVEGEAKRESAQKEGEHIVYGERSTRKYARSFSLPVEVEDAGAKARLENGILMLSLPKKLSAQPKKLTVQ